MKNVKLFFVGDSFLFFCLMIFELAGQMPNCYAAFGVNTLLSQ
jgi:hypothetical protein